jgi:hypothetical protein
MLIYSLVSCGFINYDVNGAITPYIAIVDSSNNRVIIWSSTPAQSFSASNLVLGQSSFSGSSVNAGGSPAANTLNLPGSIAFSANKFIIGDGGNNRVLIWNHLPTTNMEMADLVLGQPDFVQNSTNNGGRTNGLGFTLGVWTDGQKIIVGDRANSRILIWNQFPTQNYQAADVVLGQPGLTTGTSNFDGSVMARGMVISPVSMTRM